MQPCLRMKLLSMKLYWDGSGTTRPSVNLILYGYFFLLLAFVIGTISNNFPMLLPPLKKDPKVYRRLSSWLNGNIKTQSFTAPVILPGKGDGSVNMGSLNIPTGYTYIGVISKDSDYGDQFLCSFQRYGDHIHAVVRNVYVNQLSGDVSCTALFSKN